MGLKETRKEDSDKFVTLFQGTEFVTYIRGLALCICPSDQLAKFLAGDTAALEKESETIKEKIINDFIKVEPRLDDYDRETIVDALRSSALKQENIISDCQHE